MIGPNDQVVWMNDLADLVVWTIDLVDLAVWLIELFSLSSDDSERRSYRHSRPCAYWGVEFSPPCRLCGGLPVGCQLLDRPTCFPFVEGVGRRREELEALS